MSIASLFDLFKIIFKYFVLNFEVDIAIQFGSHHAGQRCWPYAVKQNRQWNILRHPLTFSISILYLILVGTNCSSIWTALWIFFFGVFVFIPTRFPFWNDVELMDGRLPVELVAQKRQGRGKKGKVTMKQHGDKHSKQCGWVFSPTYGLVPILAPSLT